MTMNDTNIHNNTPQRGEESTTLLLCRFINNQKNTNVHTESSTFCLNKKCSSCAWIEEQNFQAKRMKRNASILNTTLQSLIDWFLSIGLSEQLTTSNFGIKGSFDRTFHLRWTIILVFITVTSTTTFVTCHNLIPNKDTLTFLTQLHQLKKITSWTTSLILSLVLLLITTLIVNHYSRKNTGYRSSLIDHDVESFCKKYNVSSYTFHQMNSLSLPTNQKERSARYASILSKAIQLQTVSYDGRNMQSDTDDNATSWSNDKTVQNTIQTNQELLKFHQLLRTSFPLIHEKYPPTIIANYSLVYKIPGNNSKSHSNDDQKPILFCSHLDVVPAPNDPKWNQVWEHEPFSGDICDGIIWGRGAIDCKFSVIGQIAAMEELIKSNNLPSRTIYLAMGHDEEVFGMNGASNIARYFKDNNINFSFILDEGGMMVSGALPGINDPVALIGTMEKGLYCVELSVSGPGGHASMPSIKEDSVMKTMSKAILALESNPIPAHFEDETPMRKSLAYISHQVKFPFNLIYSNLWLFGSLMKFLLVRASNGAAATVRTTTAITILNGGSKSNVLPQEVKAIINHRLHPCDTIESVLEYNRRVINDSRVKMRVVGNYRPPSPISDVDSSGFKMIKTSVEAIFGHKATPFMLVGNTDTFWYWDLSPNIYRFSPIAMPLADTRMFHGLNERISVQSLVATVDFYKLMFQLKV